MAVRGWRGGRRAGTDVGRPAMSTSLATSTSTPGSLVGAGRACRVVDGGGALCVAKSMGELGGAACQIRYCLRTGPSALPRGCRWVSGQSSARCGRGGLVVWAATLWASSTRLVVPPRRSSWLDVGALVIFGSLVVWWREAVDLTWLVGPPLEDGPVDCTGRPSLVRWAAPSVWARGDISCRRVKSNGSSRGLWWYGRRKMTDPLCS